MVGRGAVGGGLFCGGVLDGAFLGMVGIGSEAIRIGSVVVRFMGVGGIDTACVAAEPEEDRGYGGVGGMVCLGEGVS